MSFGSQKMAVSGPCSQMVSSLHNKALTCICEWLSRIITANKSQVPVYEAEIKHQCVRFQMWHVSQRPKQKQTSHRFQYRQFYARGIWPWGSDCQWEEHPTKTTWTMVSVIVLLQVSTQCNGLFWLNQNNQNQILLTCQRKITETMHCYPKWAFKDKGLWFGHSV